MRGSEPYELLGGLASSATSKLNKAFLEEYHSEVDKMFARLHATNGGGVVDQTAYNDYLKRANAKPDDLEQNKYMRYEFKKQSDANRFIQDMQNHNVDVTAAPVNLHGKFLVEIPQEIEKKDKDGNTAYNARGEAQTVSVGSYVRDYEAKTGENVERYNWREDYGGKEYTDKNTNLSGVSYNFIHNEIVNGLGEFGRVVAFVDEMSSLTERYSGMNQNNAFTNDLSRGEHGKEVSYGNWSGNVGGSVGLTGLQSKAVTVYGNNTYIMDGKEVTDTDLIKSVSKLHQERSKIATQYVSEYSALGATEDAKAVKLRSSKTNEKIIKNTEAIRDNIKRQTYGIEEREHGIFKGGSLDNMRNRYGTEVILLNKHAADIEIEGDVANLLGKFRNQQDNNLSKTETEFIDKLLTRRNENGSDKPLSMTYDDMMNMTNIAQKIEWHDKHTAFLSDAELSTLASIKGVHEEGKPEVKGLFEISKEDRKMFTGGVKAELDSIREDLGINLNFQEVYGHKLTRQQLTHIDKRFEITLANAGITYSEASGKFSKNGVELDHDSLIKEVKSVDKELGKKLEEKTDSAGYKITKDGKLVHNHGKDITREDILKLDKAFLAKAEAAGYQFITPTGKFDVQAFQKLTKEDLKKIGISENTHKALLRFHSDKWGTHKWEVMGKMYGKGKKALGKLTDNDEDLQQVLKLAAAPKHVKQTATYVKQGADAARMKIDTFRAKHAKLQKKKPKPAKQKTPKVNKASKRKVTSKRNDKYLARQEKRLKRLKKSEARWKKIDKFTHKFDLKARAKEWFAQTRVGQAIFGAFNKLKLMLLKFVAYFLAAYFVFAGVVVVVVVLMSMIQSFLNAPYENTRALVDVASRIVGQEPAIIELYDFLNGMQDDWIDGVSESGTIYSNRKDIMYSADYHAYSDYVNGEIDYLQLIGGADGKLYINPFSTVDNDIETITTNNPTFNKDKAKVTGFDGKIQTEIIANPSAYAMKEGGGTTESGHTNNIKDILAMTDVMYQFDIDKFGDDAFDDNVLGGSTPWVINFDNAYNKTVGFFTFIGDCISYAGDYVKYTVSEGQEPIAARPRLGDYSGGTVSYGVIQNYCKALYQSSHQAQYDLDVEFHHWGQYDALSNVNVLKDGVSTEISQGDTKVLKQEDASWFGVCNSPVVNSFKIAYNNSNNKIFPYLINSSGNKIDLSATNSGNSVQVIMNDCKTANEKLCLWENMKTDDAATYNKIVELHDSFILESNSCWKKGTFTKDAQSMTGFSDGIYYNSRDEAKNNVKTALSNKVDGILAEEAQRDRYTLTSDHNSITKNWCEKANTNYSVRIEEKHEELPLYWDGYGSEEGNHGAGNFGGKHNMKDEYDGSGKRRVVSYKIVGDDGSWAWADEISTQRTVDIEFIGGDDDITKVKLIFRRAGVGDGTLITHVHFNHWNSNGTFNYSPNYHFEKQTWTKTTYKGIIDNAVVYYRHNDKYNRDCTGHDFSYCGGHIGCHSKGVVFSTTNEQLAMAGMYTNTDFAPRAIYTANGSTSYDMTDYGYKKIEGKLDEQGLKELRKSGEDEEMYTLSRVTNGYGNPLPEQNVQGSTNNISKGLNLRVSGDELQTGMKQRDNIRLGEFRDIFDVACSFDVGKGVFPWKATGVGGKGWKEYEGWTGDNMSFVAMRVSIDWNEVYGFDIPYEIGGAVSLPEQDINFIVKALELQYGDNFDESQEEAVRFALHWVGRGHYSENHTEHDFLTNLCHGTEGATYTDEDGNTTNICYDVSCTASNSQGFINFYLSHFGKNLTTKPSDSTITKNTKDVKSNLLPAAVFNRPMGVMNFNFKSSELKPANSKKIRKAIIELRDKDNFGIYVGTLTNVFSDEALLKEFKNTIEISEDKKTITLSSGYELHYDVPITIDLSPEPSTSVFGLNGRVGTIFLRTKKISEGVDVDGLIKADATYNPYWLTNDNYWKKYRNFNEL